MPPGGPTLLSSVVGRWGLDVQDLAEASHYRVRVCYERDTETRPPYTVNTRLDVPRNEYRSRPAGASL